MTLVTIVVLVKNAQKFLPELLPTVMNQQTDVGYELLAIDSGSRDETLEILSRYSARVISIPPEQFNHGATRNLGIQHSNPDAKYIVFLSQDAIPENNAWLNNLIQPLLEDEKVAGSFSRHVPRQKTSVSVVRQLVVMTQTGGEKRLVKEIPASIDEYEANKFYYIWFSNTSSAIRKDTWLLHPFPEVNFAEDAIWADTVLRAGYKIVFEPNSVVVHSHDYSLVEQFRQNVDHSRAMYRLFHPTSYRKLVTWLKLLAGIPLQVWQDCKFALSTSYHQGDSVFRKIYMMCRSPLWHFATIMGGFTGAYLDCLPWSFTGIFSRQERLKRS